MTDPSNRNTDSESEPLPVRRWRRAGEADLLYATYDTEAVVFHRPSGKTHLLNAESCRMMTGLLAEARDVDAIATAVADSDEASVDVEYLAHLEDLLFRLEELGLVEGF